MRRAVRLGAYAVAAAPFVAGLGSCSRAPPPSVGAPASDARDEAAAETATAGVAPAPHPSAIAGVTPVPPASTSSSTSLVDSASEAVLPPPSTGEARRTTLARLELEPLLVPHLGMLREHFGPRGGPYAVQRSDLAGGRTALLVVRADEADPIVLVVDRDQLMWSKPRPTAGILPPVRHLALSPRPDGGVVVFGWVEALRSVAARMWADDSNPFGDFDLFEPDACDALSGAFAPGFGWVVACASRGGTRVQRLREDGISVWGRYGVPIGAPSAAGPATIAFDTASTVMLVQRAAAAGGERLLAFRYDEEAHDLWDVPADLREATHVANPVERINARTVRSGLVRVDLSARSGRIIEIDSAGKVHPAGSR